MKVQLNSRYGGKLPGDVVDIKDTKRAKAMIEAGDAFDAGKSEATKDSKEVAALKTRVAALEDEVTTLKADKKTLEDEVTTLKDASK